MFEEAGSVSQRTLLDYFGFTRGRSFFWLIAFTMMDKPCGSMLAAVLCMDSSTLSIVYQS